MPDPRDEKAAHRASWEAVAWAHPNIALAKYWGKRDDGLNLPAVGSLSITLDGLVSRCAIARRRGGPWAEDVVSLNGAPAPAAMAQRVAEVVALSGAGAAGAERPALSIACENNFPTGAGLASSASGYASLALAIDRAAGLGLGPQQLGVLARRGSGSATRSLCAAFARWDRGLRDDGADSFATTLFPRDFWPLEVVVLVLRREAKAVGSRDGMNACRETSPLYAQWVAESEGALAQVYGAVARRDFARLAALAESSCLCMHQVMRAAVPPLDYWTTATHAIVARIGAMRRAGVQVFATSDAGPQVKAICAPGQGGAVAAALGGMEGVLEIYLTGLGPGAWVEDGRGSTSLSPLAPPTPVDRED